MIMSLLSLTIRLAFIMTRLAMEISYRLGLLLLLLIQEVSNWLKRRRLARAANVSDNNPINPSRPPHVADLPTAGFQPRPLHPRPGKRR